MIDPRDRAGTYQHSSGNCDSHVRQDERTWTPAITSSNNTCNTQEAMQKYTVHLQHQKREGIAHVVDDKNKGCHTLNKQPGRKQTISKGVFEVTKDEQPYKERKKERRLLPISFTAALAVSAAVSLVSLRARGK